MNETTTVKRLWPTLRRMAIIYGFICAPIAAIMWLFGVNPTVTGPAVFTALAAFLLGAKAEDDRS